MQSGDTLSSIAALCGTTVDEIRAANPGLGSSPQVGQVLNIPTAGAAGPDYAVAPAYYPQQAGGGTYVVQWGDTLGDIAARNGVSLATLLSFNRQIWNPSLVYPGQVINLPGSFNAPPPSNYGPAYYPPASYPPTYYPSSVCPPTCYPSTNWGPYGSPSGYKGLKVTYKFGLVVRSGPGRYYTELAGPYVSAVKGSIWQYRRGSETTDPQGFTWVEVALSHTVNGYSTGWLVVKDSLGNYYTDPNLDP